MGILEKFTINNVKKMLRKEFLVFASLFLIAAESFAGSSSEKKEMTPDNIKAVYAKFNEYKKTHPDTLQIKVNNFDVAMYSVGNGYEFDVTQTEDKTTYADNGKTTTTQHQVKTYKFIDQEGNGTVDDVRTSSHSSTNTVSSNVKGLTSVKASETQIAITPSFQAAASIIDQTLNKIK